MANGNTVIGVDWAVKLDSLKKQMAQVPGITSKEVKTMTAQLSKEMRAAEASVSKAAKGGKSSWDKTFKGIGDAAKGAGFGAVTEKVGNLSSAFAELASPAGVAVGVVAGGAAVVGAAALGYGLLADGLIESAFGAKAALKELRGFEMIGSDFYPAVPKEALASFDRLAASGDAVNSIWNKVSVTVATGTAPEIERLVDIVIGAGLEAETMFATWAAGRDLLVEFDKFMVGSFLQTFLPVSDAVRGLGNAYIFLSDVVGRDVDPELRAAMASTAGLRDALVAQDQALLANIDGLGEWEAAGRSFLDTQVQATKAITDHTKATKDDTDEVKRAKELQEQLNRGMEAADRIRAAGNDARTSNLTGIDKEEATLEAQLALVKDEHAAEVAALGEANAELLGLNQEYEDARAAIIAASAERVQNIREDEAANAAAVAKKAQDDQVASWEAVATATAHAANTMSSALQKSYDTSTAEGRRAAKRQWKTQHGIAIATTGALAIVSGMQAAASAPWPQNLPAMIASSIESTAAIGAVAAIQPSFHQGGLAPDEAMLGRSKVQPGEGVGVVSKQGMSSFRDANAGISPGPTNVSVELKLRHQTVDQVTAQNIQRGGQTARAILKNSSSVPFGHRRDTWRR